MTGLLNMTQKSGAVLKQRNMVSFDGNKDKSTQLLCNINNSMCRRVKDNWFIYEEDTCCFDSGFIEVYWENHGGKMWVRGKF